MIYPVINATVMKETRIYVSRSVRNANQPAFRKRYNLITTIEQKGDDQYVATTIKAERGSGKIVNVIERKYDFTAQDDLERVDAFMLRDQRWLVNS